MTPPNHPSLRSSVPPPSSIDDICTSIVNKLQDIIGTDAGGRGMKHLIVQGDLVEASRILAKSQPTNDANNDATVIILSGFPCCVQHTPPTETDGPPGAYALARACVLLGYRVVLVTEDCNEAVFAAAMEGLDWIVDSDKGTRFELEVFPADSPTTTTTTFSEEDEKRLQSLLDRSHLLLSCERAGDATNGICHTMRGINMNEKGLIASSLNRRFVEAAAADTNKSFLAIGDGGNELGMGKVLDRIKKHIPRGDLIGCAIPADYLIAASVSNWGGYALAVGAAVMKAGMECSNCHDDDDDDDNENENSVNTDLLKEKIREWVERCVPTEQEEIDLLQRCVDKGCRDGVSGKVEATVDGMPLETSMKCLRDLRQAACLF